MTKKTFWTDMLTPLPKLPDMDWPDAQRAVLDGHKLTRQAWGNPSICVYLADGLLKIRNADHTLHALLVSDGDMHAADWTIVRET